MKAAELHKRLAEAPAELEGYANRIASTNGSGPDEALRQDALDYAREVIDDADALEVTEKRPDPERNRVRKAAEELFAALDGSGERARDKAWAEFQNEQGEPVDPLKHLRSRLNCPDLRRVIKHGRSNSLWDLELQDSSRISLGNSEQIQEPKKVRGALLSVGRSIKRMKYTEHDLIVDAIALVAEVEDTIASEVEETLSWIASFASMMGGARARSLEGDHLLNLLADPDEVPVFCDPQGRLYLRLPKLAQHVTKGIGQRTTVRDLAARLDRAGFVKDQLAARDGERTLKARYWRSPAGFDVEGEA